MSQQSPTPQAANGHHRPLKGNGASSSRPRPLHRLSLDLIDTYRFINKKYYERKKKRQLHEMAAHNEPSSGVEGAEPWDDENFDYILRKEEVFNGRYRVIERIGKGSFGQVVRAFDSDLQREVAIKIIKSKKPFLLQAATEVELLQFLNERDPADSYFVVRLLDVFHYRGHKCLVFEMLSYNLYELLRNTNFQGVSLNLIRKFARQILKCLAFLALPEINIIHCDLKPENILLRHPKRSAVKVIDFGSSCFADKRMYSYIQSRFYRSPEVMLGLPYTVAIDIWSLGCILVEMHTGEPLFSGTDQYDQMRRLVALRGLPPREMLDMAPKRNLDLFFMKRGSKDSRPTYSLLQPKDTSEDIKPSSLEELLGVKSGGPGGRRHGEKGHSARQYTLFLDLINRMLEYRPDKRITPEEALKHPFCVEEEPRLGGRGDAGSRAVEPTIQAKPTTSVMKAAAIGKKRRSRSAPYPLRGQAAG